MPFVVVIIGNISNTTNNNISLQMLIYKLVINIHFSVIATLCQCLIIHVIFLKESII